MPTESRQLEAALRERIGKLLDEGTLPVMVSDVVDAAYGSGAHDCCCCGKRIERVADIEYEILDQRTRQPMHFHLACHALWKLECVRRLQERQRARRRLH